MYLGSMHFHTLYISIEAFSRSVIALYQYHYHVKRKELDAQIFKICFYQDYFIPDI